RFASAYWVRDIEPADPSAGQASVDARSLAIPDPPHTAAPEASGPASPGQTAPHVASGQAWQTSGKVPPTSNGFTAKLAGAAAVTLDTAGMHLSTARPIAGAVGTDRAVTLILAGRFAPGTVVTVDGVRLPARPGGDALRI